MTRHLERQFLPPSAKNPGGAHVSVYVSSTSGVASPGVPAPGYGLRLGVCLCCCWRLDAHCCALIAHSASDVFSMSAPGPAPPPADDGGAGLGEFITPAAAVHGW